jgi:phage baseplate assembly protein W
MGRGILMERSIVLPFSVDSSGTILSSNDQRIIWQSRVTSAVLTQIGERVFRPNYGGTIQSALFQTLEEAAEIAAASVREVFGLYLNALVLDQTQTSLNQQEGTLTLTIDYTLPNQDKGQVSLKAGILNRSGDIIQEY